MDKTKNKKIRESPKAKKKKRKWSSWFYADTKEDAKKSEKDVDFKARMRRFK